MSRFIGKVLGKVKIDILLARGGLADVYLGTHTTLQHPVAVKVLRSQFRDDPELMQRFQREAYAVARLRHPNIVQVMDFDSVDGQAFLVMEYIPGLSLERYLHELHGANQRLDKTTISHIITKIADALQYAHRQDVIHRDVKPGNIMLHSPTKPIAAGVPLPEDTEPILTDFGLVRFLQPSMQTSTGLVAGTPAYMSPEQAQGKATDGRSDIYSLGVVLYELLAGHIPFEADTALGVLNQHINTPPEPITGLKTQLQRVLNTAMAKDPGDRFQTTGDLAAAFQSAYEDQMAAPTLMPTTVELPTKTPNKNWLPVILGSAFMVLTVAAFFFLGPLFGDAQTSPPTTPADTPVPATLSPTPEAVLPEEQPSAPLGRLRFQDGAAFLDQVTLTSFNLTIPPSEEQYEAWLLGGEQRRSLGVLELDASGQGSLNFVDSEGRNMLALFDTLEITREPKTDSNPNPSDEVQFRVSLPTGGLAHVRHLLVSFSAVPQQKPLILGLYSDARLIDEMARDLLEAYQAGDESALHAQAEGILNVLVGSQSEQYLDWDEDGEISDPGDGFGFLLNGDNSGYIEAVAAHAEFAAASPDASENIILHGNHVITSAQNLETPSLQLRDNMITIFALPMGAEMEAVIRELVAQADFILNGIDLNGNELIEPIPGEGGASTAYEHAFYMADIILIP